ncbi:hypothetical protein [Microcystis aeruginosa]|uniref:hypothetical protein n=1 Tax=Microcystis aeruginosa TaxID=1126 RepID=UPI0005A29C96|nr:hypothetical protein [Microcystis aeruginosa]
MPKYYVIPIDNFDQAYFGIRSLLNPYNRQVNWCAGTPNVFGGRGTEARETIYRETREESRFKIDIDQCGATLHQIHQSNGMTFYAIRNRFVYYPDPYFPALLGNRPEYQECTGEILRVNLNAVNTDNSISAGSYVIKEFRLFVTLYAKSTYKMPR